MESKMILKDLGPAGLRGVRCKGEGWILSVNHGKGAWPNVGSAY